jgi:hypothetical protein
MVWKLPLGSMLVAGVAAFAACSAAPAPFEFDVLTGPCQDVYGGEVCAWGLRTDAGITAIGANVPLAMVEGAPMDLPMVFPPVPTAVLALPAEVAEATGFNHLQVGWELHGHPPGTFMTPHWDFHFYTTTPEATAAVDCSDLTKPASGPAGYTLPDIEIPGMGTLVGLCVPTMGMHAMAANEVAAAEPFGASMIIGYYGGALTFLEPMISKAKLMEAATFDMAVPPAPPGTPASVRWPKTFQAEYQPDTRSYRFVFGLE